MADEMNEEPKGFAPAKPFRSHAIWPPDCCPAIGNVSQDDHYTREEAEGVCNLLRRNGFGGDGKFFPVSVWVEELTPPEQPLCVCGHEKASHRFGPHKQECGENLGKDMCTCWSFRPVQPAQGEGKPAPAQTMSVEERAANLADLIFAHLEPDDCEIIFDASKSHTAHLILSTLTAHGAAEVARVEGELQTVRGLWRDAASLRDQFAEEMGKWKDEWTKEHRIGGGLIDQLAQLRETLAQKEEEVARLRDRLQIDPGGSDKIDELESAMEHLRSSVARVERERDEARRLAEGYLNNAAGGCGACAEATATGCTFAEHEPKCFVTQFRTALSENTALKAQVELVAQLITDNARHWESCVIYNGPEEECNCWKALALSTLQPKGAK